MLTVGDGVTVGDGAMVGVLVGMFVAEGTGVLVLTFGTEIVWPAKMILEPPRQLANCNSATETP